MNIKNLIEYLRDEKHGVVSLTKLFPYPFNSVKFLAFFGSLASIVLTYASGDLSLPDAMWAVIISAAAFQAAKAYEDGNK